jgi:hypothetical protein
MTRVFQQRKGLHRVGITEHQKAIAATQTAVNAMIRERDAGQPCISCGKPRKLEAGHFRNSNQGTTRFHPWNLNGQCATCNRYSGGVTYEYGVALDRKWGRGTAAFIERLSRKIEPWETRELGTLRDAARRGARVYEQTYFTLRSGHERVAK